MLNEIFALDRRLALGNERLRLNFPEHELIQLLINTYLAKYADFNHLTPKMVIDLYDKFAKSYSQHLKVFRETGQYPFEYEKQHLADRLSYDIALIISCAINPARFQIASHLCHYIRQLHKKRVCVIGAGAGIELEIIQNYGKNMSVTAYDISLHDFIKSNFASFELKEAYFDKTEPVANFDTILSIELLEHLADPLMFLESIYSVLKPASQFICTTATNMPQFDHLYNFTDIERFKNELISIGFRIVEHKEFKQSYMFNGVEAKNDWFILEK